MVSMMRSNRKTLLLQFPSKEKKVGENIIYTHDSLTIVIRSLALIGERSSVTLTNFMRKGVTTKDKVSDFIAWVDHEQLKQEIIDEVFCYRHILISHLRVNSYTQSPLVISPTFYCLLLRVVPVIF